MIRAIARRELITLDGQGVLMRGTFHKPSLTTPPVAGSSVAGSSVAGSPIIGSPVAVSSGETGNRIGVVFLNSLSIPRAGTGDSAVYWAESLASSGYPAFRLDLPGLGDTAGAIPNELLDFINAGGYGAITSAKMEELVARYRLSGVVLVGHCAGTVSALFAAGGGMTNCKGLILMDPYFHLPQAVRSKVRRGLSDWALQSNLGRWLSNIYDRVRDVAKRFQGNSLPANANVRLLNHWKQVATSGMPILLLKAPARKAQGTKARVGEFDYLEHVLRIARDNSKVTLELIEGTDHSFANQRGRISVRHSMEGWLGQHFPAHVQAPAAGVHPMCARQDRDHECQLSGLHN